MDLEKASNDNNGFPVKPSRKTPALFMRYIREAIVWHENRLSLGNLTEAEKMHHLKHIANCKKYNKRVFKMTRWYGLSGEMPKYEVTE